MVLRQLEHRRRLRGREVEVVVERGRMLHRGHDAPGEVAAVGVVPHLAAVAEDVERVLALHDLLHQVGDHVAHRELDVARSATSTSPRARISPMPTQLNGRTIV